MPDSAPAPAPVVVVGAGPAGLTAAWELDALGRTDVQVFEADAVVGGIARTNEYRGYRYDLGGHRFFTRVQRVQQLWEEILGDELLVRPRLSRILYRGAWFDYPLRPLRALWSLGPLESLRVGASLLRARLWPEPEERTFDQWVSNRFGRRLFDIFFRTYTEKVWGIPCEEIGAEWAAQRIKDLDLVGALRTALLGGPRATSLIEEFHYPRLGPGQMWERCADLLERRGVAVHTSTPVVTIRHAAGRVHSAVTADGGEHRVGHLVSSMPLSSLIDAMDPPAPAAVRLAARTLRYRDFLTVLLLVRGGDRFPDNWLYVHAPEVRVGRVQNFGNWSPDLLADPNTSALGLEYFVNRDDPLWTAPDEEVVAFATQELAAIGLADASDVFDGCVARVPKAYPVYDGGWRAAVDTIRGWIAPLENLHVVGRNGQHRYNNQDHSMLTGILAAENIASSTQHDLWSVNVEADYHEGATPRGDSGDRLVPRRVSRVAGRA